MPTSTSVIKVQYRKIETVLYNKLTETSILLLKGYHTRWEETTKPKSVSFCQREASVLLLKNPQKKENKTEKGRKKYNCQSSVLHLQIDDSFKCNFPLTV